MIRLIRTSIFLANARAFALFHAGNRLENLPFLLRHERLGPAIFSTIGPILPDAASDRAVAWLFLYCRNLTVASLEQVLVPAPQTLYVYLARPVSPVESV